MKKLKKFISRIRELENWAALLMAGAAMMFTACSSSSDDSIIEQPTPQPVTGKYTMTVQASKGGDAMTRALGYDSNTKTLSAEWKAGEYVYVFKGETLLGWLSVTDISSDKTTCTLTGTLETDLVSSAGGIEDGEELTLGYHPPGANVYNDAQDGTLETLASYYDYAEATINANVTTDGEGNTTITTSSNVNFENQQAVVCFTLQDAAGNPINATSLSISDNDDSNINYIAINTKNSETLSTFFVALKDITSKNITVTASDGTSTYVYTRLGVTFTNGKFYDIKIKMLKENDMINLSTMLASQLPNATLTLKSGDVLTGTLDGSTEDGKVKIEIAAGATVTLHNAHINGYHYSDTECRWAGINCLGDATIVLSGENSVTNFNRYYPAILAAHNDTGSGTEYTLTIRGSGKLTATGTIFGAGIGGGSDSDIGNIPCGNICIESGTIIANGGSGSAAIGGGSSASCGNITISGGNVKATADAEYGGAGIGSGGNGSSGASCGDITISGTANVTAMGGDDAAGIGSGWAMNNTTNECGKISISGACKVTATGGKGGAGIGTGYQATCGDISINGGIITAQGGGKAAGIGCGDQNVINGGRMSECGAITIVDGGNFTSVTAIRGQDALRPIGHSNYNRDWNTCGNIIFGDKTVYTAGIEPMNYNITGIRDLNFTKTTTDLGGGEDYTNNTWVLTKK